MKNSDFDKNKKHTTANGEKVRSKSEVIIADALFHNKIKYFYENPVEIKGEKKFPDFTIIHRHEVFYWEHLGLMNKEKYRQDWAKKKEVFKKDGIIEGENLIITRDDEDESINSQEIQKLIEKYFINKKPTQNRKSDTSDDFYSKYKGILIPCRECNDYYTIKKSKNGDFFVGCANFRETKCKSTFKINDFLTEIINNFDSDKVTT
jgi:hypothetical protein